MPAILQVEMALRALRAFAMYRLKVFRLALSHHNKVFGLQAPLPFFLLQATLSSLRSLVFFFALLHLEACLQANWNTFVPQTHEVRGHMQLKFKTKSETSSMCISHTGSFHTKCYSWTIHTFYYLRIGGVRLTVKLGKR